MEKSSNKFYILGQDDVDNKDEADIYELNKEAITTKIYSLKSLKLTKCHQTDKIKENFDVIPVKGDGNCFYYCLEEAAKLGLLGKDNINKTHKNFRQEAYTIINANREKYSDIFEGSVEEQKVNIDKIKEDKNWADNPEILALAEKYDLQFIILRMEGGETKISDSEKQNKIYLYYCNYTRGEVKNHYELLIPKQISTPTPTPTLTPTPPTPPTQLTPTLTPLVPKKSVPIQLPKGTIQDYNKIEEQEDKQYFIYNLNIDDNEFYKIILKYPTQNENILQLKNLFTEILNKFLGSENYIKNYRDKSEYYPELFTLLFGDYLKFIGDNKKLLSEFDISPEHKKKIISKYSDNLSVYVKNYLKWGLKLDNTKEINKRIFMNNLLDSIISPNNIKDNFSPNPNNNEIKKLYQLKDDFIENDKILPKKRETYFSTRAIKEDYENNNLSFENYEKIYNYNLDEKININNGYTFIIDWIFKTFCKSYLEYYIIGKEKLTLTPTDFEKLNEYFDAQKNIKTNPQNYIEITNFLELKTNKKYQQIFYNKWKDLLNYFGNFKKYYYDDKYYNEIVNKSQLLSHCLENFISNKVIPNDDNDDPSNFRYLFTYCLMTKSSREKLESIFSNISKEDIINISNIKWKFFNYLKYLQDLNQFNHNCKLEFESNKPIVNYCNYYFAKQLEFYGRLKLNFNEYHIQPDSEIFYNYIIYLVMSKPVIYLCKILNISEEKFVDVVKLFISSQYEKIYTEKTINLYKINFTQSFADLYSSFLQVHTEKFDKLNELVQIVIKSEPKSKKQIDFAIGVGKCVGCPDYNIGDTNEKYYINQIDTIFGQPTYVEISKKDEKSTDIEDSELPPLGNVLREPVNNYKFLRLNYERDDIEEEYYVLELTGEYNYSVIDCIERIINSSYDYGFFDLIYIVEGSQLDRFKNIVGGELKLMADYIQTEMYEKNTSAFKCKDLSKEFEDNILNILDDDGIYKEIVGCFDGSTDNTIKISYRYFYQQDKGETIGNYIYGKIEHNKYMSGENSFLEIIKNKVRNDKKSNIKNYNTLNNNFIGFVNEELNNLIGYYKKNETSFDYDELINDLSNLVADRFSKLKTETKKPDEKYLPEQGIKLSPPKEQTVSYAEALAPGIETQVKSTIYIGDTNIPIYLEPDTDKINIGDKTLYQIIKSYLEDCGEIVELSKYYYPNQIQSGISTIANYYKDGYIKIDDTSFCDDFTSNLLCLMIQEIIPLDRTIKGINIKPEYFDLWLNKYINMGIAIINFISLSTIFSRLDSKYLQDGFDYLYEIYSNEVEELKKMTTKEGFNKQIYEDISRYIYIRKCLDDFFNGERFVRDIKPEYTENNIKLIENGMIDMLFKNKIINKPFGKKIINIEIKIGDRCPLDAEFTKLFGYIKSTQKIPKISEMPNIAPSLTKPVKTTEQTQIFLDYGQQKYIIPDKYSSYKIISKKPSEPQNLQQCLEGYLNGEHFKMIAKDYKPGDLLNIINTMAEKLTRPTELPNQYGNLRKQWCFGRELNSLFTLTRDELKIAKK